MGSTDELASAILRVIADTVQAKGLDAARIGLDAPVDSRLGLDSLDWAAVVVRLEIETGIDPFASGAAGELKTISDIVNLYAMAPR